MVNLYQNKTPVFEIVSGASIAIAALLLIIPGFFTDFIGFVLLIPFSRKILLSFALRNKTNPEEKDQNKIIDGEIVEKEKDEL